MRGTLEKEHETGARARTINAVTALGSIATGFAPFFVAAEASRHFLAAVNIANDPLVNGARLVFPDTIIRELARLDDQMIKDGMVVPNNTQLRTRTFVPKEVVRVNTTRNFQSSRTWISKNDPTPEFTFTMGPPISITIPPGRVSDLPEDFRKLASVRATLADIGSGRGTAGPYALIITVPKTGPDPVLVEVGGASNLLNGIGNYDPDKKRRAKDADDPVAVMAALHELVLVGDRIQYLPRVRVVSTPEGTGLVPPPKIFGIDPKLKSGTTFSLSVFGANFKSGHAFAGTGMQIIEGSEKVDPNGNSIEFDAKFDKPGKYELSVSTPEGADSMEFCGSGAGGTFAIQIVCTSRTHSNAASSFVWISRTKAKTAGS